MVFEPNQIYSLHYLAQLQVDHFENPALGHVGGFSRAVLLRFTRLHHQENVRSLNYIEEDKKAFYFEKKENSLSISKLLSIIITALHYNFVES